MLVNNIYRDFPFSEEGKKLNLSDDLFEKCKLVYRKNDEAGKWEFDGFWDGNKIDDLQKMVVPVQSVYGGLVCVDAGTPFVNVIGSTYDPKPTPNTSWIKFIQCVYAHNNYSYDNTCCANNRIYFHTGDENNPSVSERDLCCSGTLVGGHVLINQCYNITSYPNSTVYLLPICSRHNVYRFNDNRTGAGFFMLTDRKIPAIQLDAFLCKSFVLQFENWCRTNSFTFPPSF